MGEGEEEHLLLRLNLYQNQSPGENPRGGRSCQRQRNNRQNQPNLPLLLLHPTCLGLIPLPLPPPTTTMRLGMHSADLPRLILHFRQTLGALLLPPHRLPLHSPRLQLPQVHFRRTLAISVNSSRRSPRWCHFLPLGSLLNRLHSPLLFRPTLIRPQFPTKCPFSSSLIRCRSRLLKCSNLRCNSREGSQTFHLPPECPNRLNCSSPARCPNSLRKCSNLIRCNSREALRTFHPPLSWRNRILKCIN